MNKKMNVEKIIEQHIETAKKTQMLSKEIENICVICFDAIQKGKKIFIAGNGGSAADAQHIAAEFVGRFITERRALPALALTTDTSVLTSISNDYGFETIFSRQLEAFAQEGDIFIAISTSGTSKNIIKAVETAEQKKLKTIGFLGKSGGILKDRVDVALVIPSDDTARIQEMHILVGHIICAYVDEKMNNEQ